MDTITKTQNKLRAYSKRANELLYQTPKVIKQTTIELSDTIKTYATLTGQKIETISTKSNLSNWQNDTVDYFINQTSGTTGAPFKYRIWKDIFSTIEINSHYGLINQEFNVPEQAKVLYLGLNINITSDDIIKTIRSSDIMITHGFQQSADIGTINPLYAKSLHEYVKQIYNHCISEQYDVILATDEILSPLVYLLEKNILQPNKLAGLLSCTGNSTSVDTIRKLLELEVFTNACDHMRCWDGGATFFTCNKGTRHLCDNLSECCVDDSLRLLSTDFFSLPNPFINYWNGDYADILDEYQKCECGRYFRPFTLYKAEDTTEFQFFYDILGYGIVKRISASHDGYRLVTNTRISDRHMKELIIASNPYRLDFIIEEA